MTSYDYRVEKLWNWNIYFDIKNIKRLIKQNDYEYEQLESCSNILFIGQPISNNHNVIINSEGMGNETSILEQCTIDESPILKSKYWSLHHGQRDEDHAQLSVFVSKQKRVSNDENILFQSAKVHEWDDFYFRVEIV